MSAITGTEHRQFAARLRDVLSIYEKNRDLILIGAYEKGSDPRVEYALQMIDRVNAYLKQDTDERLIGNAAVEGLRTMFAN
jgi:flagellar biosynthesis/type III secretory pathway ATPase